jgi:SAM-dependent methyltransferase
MKLDLENTKNEYSLESRVKEYISYVENIGLWQSEKIILTKYINVQNNILDIGCGAGRTTFGLYDIGYHNIIGVDLSEKMILAAKKIAHDKNIEISFIVKNACDLAFDADSFDAVFFSANGIMTIPGKEMRQKAFNEIYKVLKPGGIFIFTTHDINNPQYIDYWNKERIKWENGEQDKRLLEYGDLIFSDPDTYNGSVNFVHIPLDGEIEKNLERSGFHLVYNELRKNICEEKPELLDITVDCMFWIVKK